MLTIFCERASRPLIRVKTFNQSCDPLSYNPKEFPQQYFQN